MKSMQAMRRATMSVALLLAGQIGVVLPLFAQSIAVTTPRLPPRNDAPGAAQYAQPGAQTAVQQPASTAAPGGGYVSPAAPGGGYVSPAAPGGGYVNPAAPGGGYVIPAAQAGSYAGQGAQVGAYAGGSAQGGIHANPALGTAHAAYGAPPVASVMPQRAAAGNCRVVPTPDRQSLTLVSGEPALARSHVALGEFRSQQLVHSPDGRWAVVITKLRGAAQFAALTIDLERCEVQRTIELAAAGEDVRFEGDEALLRIGGSERRVALRDGSVR